MSDGNRPLPLIDYGNFRLSLKRLEEQYANYQSAEIIRPRLDREGVAESVVRRFKACYDYLWKVLRRYLIHQLGIPDVPNSPKPIFRLADQNGLFRLPLDQWMLYAERRVDTSDDYDGEKDNACLEVVAGFIDAAADLYETMSGKTTHGDLVPKPGFGAATAGNSSLIGSEWSQRNAT